MNSSPQKSNTLFENRKRKVFETLDHLPHVHIVTIFSCNHWEICDGRRRKYDLLKTDTEGGKFLNQFDRNNGKT